MSDRSDEETDDPHYADLSDRRNFYKVEKWSRDGLRVELRSTPVAASTRRAASSSGRPSTGRASGSRSGSACGCWTSGHGTKRCFDPGKFALLDSAAAELCYRKTVIGYDDA